MRRPRTYTFLSTLRTVRLSDLRAGDGVWIDHHGTHPGVVIHVDPDTAILVIGSSKGRPHYAEVCIQPNSPAAKALGLTAPTYFNATRVAVIRDAKAVVRKTRRCPPEPFQQLAALIEDMVKRHRKDAQRRTAATPAEAAPSPSSAPPAEPAGNRASAPRAEAAPTPSSPPPAKPAGDPGSGEA